MNGYELTLKLRKARRRHRLSAPTQALYHELVAICNEEEWPDEFRCSNDELCTALHISEKSLVTYRVELIQAGLLYYLSGKSKKKVGTYSFKKEFLNGCKFYNQSDSLTGSQLGSQSGGEPGEKPSDSIKTKTETKIFIVIDKKKYFLVGLHDLFDADEGLKMRWKGYGLPGEKFLHGVDLWTQRHHRKEYFDFQKARDHFFNWIQYYESESKKKTNATDQRYTTSKPAKNSGANELLGQLRDELTGDGRREAHAG